MAIMATGMARKNSFKRVTLTLILLPAFVSAGEWSFTPKALFNQTYSDNVTLTENKQNSSFVNQTALALNTEFTARLATFKFNGKTTYASYTHDHELDDFYNAIDASASIKLWRDGPALIAKTVTQNHSGNRSKNSLADLVSADTVQVATHSSGLAYNIENNDFSIKSSAIYFVRESDDNIGETSGYQSHFVSQSGINSRLLFWDINGQYNDQKNQRFTGDYYSVEALLGLITPYKVNPFIRYYDEDSSGNISTGQSTAMQSTGVGFRWLVARHLFIGASYNFVADEQLSDDYVALSLNWKPSQRTSVTASFSQRFFGDSYHLALDHKTKRLTNKISYNESVTMFDRENYQRKALGAYWCPRSNDKLLDVNNCILAADQNISPDNYQLVALFATELVDANEFALNKTLIWTSELALPRTKFSFSVRNIERESLASSTLDNTLDVSITATRTVSGKSKVSLTSNFQHIEFNKNNINLTEQDDYYRTIAASYNRQLAPSLFTTFSLSHLDRNSSQAQLSYQETRAAINLTKDF